MKWLLFFALFFLTSCKSKNNVKPADQNFSTQPNNINPAPLPFETEKDSGYFRGHPAEKLDVIDVNDSTMLSLYLSKIISKKDIVLLDSSTLSHSVFIDQKSKMRYDTLRNSHTVITSQYNFSQLESQIIKLNDQVIRNYKWNGIDSLRDDILDMEHNSFRHFSFRGKEFYYIRTRIMDGHYGSIHTISYHLIYNPGADKPNFFRTCRFEDMLFGNVNGDDKLDYLDFDNSDFCTGVPSSDHVTIQLYSCNKNGQFILQKDNKGRSYFIDGRTGAGYTQDSFNVIRSYWIRPIK